MLKGQVTKIIAETTQGTQLTREEKFQVFCNVCDNLLKEGRISSAKHYAWTNVF